MRFSLVLMVMVVCALAVVGAVVLTFELALADSGSISRDSRGSATYGERDPLGGPPTPRLYLLGQPLIFCAGLTFLALAVLLGAYTLITQRRSSDPLR